MLYFDRIDIFQGTDINKTSASKECDISHHCFLTKSSSFNHTYVADAMIY